MNSIFKLLALISAVIAIAAYFKGSIKIMSICAIVMIIFLGISGLLGKKKDR